MSDTKTRAEKKLSVIPKGHWRNKAWILPDLMDWMKEQGTEFEPTPDGNYIGKRTWVSREMAEEAGEVMRVRFAEISGGADWFRYLGPVFFPDTA